FETTADSQQCLQRKLKCHWLTRRSPAISLLCLPIRWTHPDLAGESWISAASRRSHDLTRDLILFDKHRCGLNPRRLHNWREAAAELVPWPDVLARKHATSTG